MAAGRGRCRGGHLRPRRIARRFYARASHWNRPHVHCPGCGADGTLPEVGREAPCFTCGTPWIRLALDAAEAQVAAAARGRAYVSVRHALEVDVPIADGRRGARLVPCLLLYFPVVEHER